MTHTPKKLTPAPALSTTSVTVSAPAAPLQPFNGVAAQTAVAPAATPASVQPPAGAHSYLDRIAPVFYSYRLADFNRRYYAVFLERAERKNFMAQVAIAVLTAIAFCSLAIPSALSDEVIISWVHRINPIAAVVSALAFFASVIAPLFKWDKAIDDFTVRVHAWEFARNQIESALRFLIHDAKSERDAELQVSFADAAFRIANSLPQVGQDEQELSDRIKEEVEKAYPPDYPWRAL